jgi:hypothetical protein
VLGSPTEQTPVFAAVMRGPSSASPQLPPRPRAPSSSPVYGDASPDSITPGGLRRVRSSSNACLGVRGAARTPSRPDGLNRPRSSSRLASPAMWRRLRPVAPARERSLSMRWKPTRLAVSESRPTARAARRRSEQATPRRTKRPESKRERSSSFGGQFGDVFQVQAHPHRRRVQRCRWPRSGRS